ncbi:glycoside hydrolase family 68 protein [Novosphingobium huizhouense]|uniref:glycoside hydrolase family 68 protein n=1 Tax=Novosphingobium huizhouense TaxID=2866625 RepID=UPI001CD8C81F|nr:glycoside hydrolase family 68 protein [Novosphingobium huizhouense]
MPAPSPWRARHLDAIRAGDPAPLIAERDIVRVSDTTDVWDAWPVQRRDGHPFTLADGAQVWMALAAPRFPDPDERHGHARITLFRRAADGAWRELGPAMPDGFSPGSREWSGSAIAEPDGALTLYFTAAGRRGEPALSFEQRMFRARATLGADGRCTAWRDLAEIVPLDPAHYMPTTAGGGIGTIKAWRDPSYFRDECGRHWLTFAASLAGSPSAFNGVVGAAWAAAETPEDWRLVPPIVSADGLNNELERPHLVAHGGRVYLFWSTQAHVFDPAGPVGPTGLYGMVAPSVEGPWQPLNGSGLVFANPPEAPAQAYSWMVLPDLSVTSFVDNWGGGDVRRFGATFAPFLHLALDGASAALRQD